MDIELIVPTMEEGDDFFECFQDIFFNYSRFSTIQPAFPFFFNSLTDSPLLGTIDTPWEKVDAFYKFWREFHSWRVYSAYDEYNLEVSFLC